MSIGGCRDHTHPVGRRGRLGNYSGTRVSDPVKVTHLFGFDRAHRDRREITGTLPLAMRFFSRAHKSVCYEKPVIEACKIPAAIEPLALTSVKRVLKTP